MNLVKGLSINFILSKKQVLVSLIFSIILSLSMSTVIFIISFPLMTLGFVLFLVPLDGKLGQLFETFLVS